MERLIFVNLPVRDVRASRAFYTALGFRVHDRFSDDQVACIAVSSSILLMLLDHERFTEFIADDAHDADDAADAPEARGVRQVLNGLSATSRAEVDDIVARAVAAGGVVRGRVEQGSMYGRSFADPDGHVWELIHMALPAAPAPPPTPAPPPR